MNKSVQKYCLDTNVLIQAWDKYYSPDLCPDYWDLLNELGKNSKIFIPQLVFEEITRVEDELSKWLKTSKIPIQKINESITKNLKDIYSKDSSHQYLVSNNGQHSLADPWVIAHAMFESAVVVTKEIKDYYKKPTKIKIPHVCDNMKIRWIDDFQLLKELKVKFSCKID